MHEASRVAGGSLFFLLFLLSSESQILLAILAGVLLGWTAAHHVYRAYKKGKFSIDGLMLIAAVGAIILGESWEGLLLLFLFSIAHMLETYAEWRTENSLKKTTERFPTKAMKQFAEGWQEVLLEEVIVGDLLLLRAGEIVPVDGIVLGGKSSVDESSVSGESIPIEKNPGDLLKSGTLNLSGQLEFRAESVAKDSTAQRIAELVEAAREKQSEEQVFADVVGERYTLFVLIVSGLSLVFWLFRGVAFRDAIYSTLALLVVASPCALVLSVPAAVLAAIARSASSGVIFRGGKALDSLAKVKQFCFDKTGTLTTGKLALNSVTNINGERFDKGKENEFIRKVASLEQGSTHPIALAFLRIAKEQEIELYQTEVVTIYAGLGLEGKVDGSDCRVGNRAFVGLEKGGSNFGTLEVCARIEDEIAIFEFADSIRKEAPTVIGELKSLGCGSVILSGDRASSVERISKELDLQKALSNLSPEEKLTELKRLRKAGGAIAMVGDGMNDAPSLTGADVAVVMGERGSGAALREAGVILVNDALGQLPFALKLSRKARQVIMQNLAISIGIASLLIAFAVYRSLSLSLGVLGHEGSTVIVILNSLRLLRK